MVLELLSRQIVVIGHERKKQDKDDKSPSAIEAVLWWVSCRSVGNCRVVCEWDRSREEVLPCQGVIRGIPGTAVS